MKKVFIFFIAAAVSLSSTICAGAWTSEGNGWVKGNLGWSYVINGIYLDGWRKIDGKIYYFYKDTNFMAHDTIIDGYYINSDGAVTFNIPDGISKIMKMDLEYINSYFNGRGWSFYSEENVNFKVLCDGKWDVPDINGNVYWIQQGDMDCIGYFVSGDDVYVLGNQGGMDIYKVENNKIVMQIPYNSGISYKWR
ncbi:MAG: cell wall-binding protein [Clostridium sp.]